ncbi:MAG: DMT family transporter [Xanthobacteraceae bacterium]|nr:DMT family transporter [Xanthobacteraceae bacterium]MBX3523985.1 DMT family transporter [Xanthobacteraceae bacterium]MBX3535189.1 DMT family transporter [Xanthobacteraceae bacterium]MBX3550276.1 DMT family transporter [Xanthobacteraceae bacterium]MCW5674188.1 DMT family transporter [Xanthobacteraceae bacterium]
MSDPSAASRRGMLFMVLAMALFAANDAGTKYAVKTLPVSEVMIWRGGFALIFVAAILVWRGEWREAPKVFDWQVSLRGFAEAGNGVLLISALALIPLGNVITIIQLVPFIMTIIGAMMLGERVGWRRWIAVGAGFLGVIFVVKPVTGSFDAASLFALAATFTILLRDMLARSIGTRVPAFVVALSSILAGIAVGAGGLFFQTWQTPSAAALLACLASGICLVLAQFFIVLAYRGTELSAVAPFRYTIVVFAVIYGFVFFNEVPDLWSLAGMGLMIGAGLYMLHREARRARTATTRGK